MLSHISRNSNMRQVLHNFPTLMRYPFAKTIKSDERSASTFSTLNQYCMVYAMGKMHECESYLSARTNRTSENFGVRSACRNVYQNNNEFCARPPWTRRTTNGRRKKKNNLRRSQRKWYEFWGISFVISRMRQKQNHSLSSHVRLCIFSIFKSQKRLLDSFSLLRRMFIEMCVQMDWFGVHIEPTLNRWQISCSPTFTVRTFHRKTKIKQSLIVRRIVLLRLVYCMKLTDERRANCMKSEKIKQN